MQLLATGFEALPLGRVKPALALSLSIALVLTMIERRRLFSPG